MTSRFARMRQAVAEIYDRNRQRGHAAWCGLDYDFVCPSSGTYPFQWFWDSCFHAIVLTHLDVERAAVELTSLLANAQPDGMVAHVTFWQRERYEEMLKTYAIAYRTPYLSDCMQPPLLAEAVAAVARRGAGAGFVRDVLPRVRAYYDWLHRVRDPDGDGLIAILQPDESGLDHSPKWDAYLGVTEPTHAGLTRGWQRVADAHAAVGRDPARMFERDVFVVEDVMVNTLYALSQRALAGLLAGAGDAAGAAEVGARAARTVAALVEKCWDPEAGLFFDLAGRREEKLRVSTATSLFPLALPDLPPEIARTLIARLGDPADYGAEFPVPSVSMREPAFCPRQEPGSLVFRGTTWMNLNWYLARGLRVHGERELARRLTDRSAALVERGGFREYYNPHTGEGYGAHGFAWTALALEMLAAEEEA